MDIINHHLDNNSDSSFMYMKKKLGIVYYAYFWVMIEYFCDNDNEFINTDDEIESFALCENMCIDANELKVVLENFYKLGYLIKNESDHYCLCDISFNYFIVNLF